MQTFRIPFAPGLACAVLGMALTACARPRASLTPARETVRAAGSSSMLASRAGPCVACIGRVPDDDDVKQAVALRVAELKARGGACQAYGAVLEESLGANQIVVRPFMWRVGPYLASAQAKSTGEIDVARDVDALNIGLRSLDEVVHSVEHEAAHIAFAIPSGTPFTEGLVDGRVLECRGRAVRPGAAP